MVDLIYLLACWACILLLVRADNDGIIASAASSLANELVGDTQYVDRFSPCEFVKKLFGVSYDQLQGDKAPNLENLSLVYRTMNGTQVFKMDTAAQALRQQRDFVDDKRLVIFVHGYMDSSTKEAFSNMTQVFLANGNTNLIALDASSVTLIYPSTTLYVRVIGQKLGEVLAAFVQQGQNPSNIHIIGHSLGAHIAGFAGKFFHDLTRKRFRMIIGLDPARPCFDAVHPDARLEDTDAEFVSAIHTDAHMFGIKEPVGHIDYYPNGGSGQPNCILLGCSHIRAWMLYFESVGNPLAFPAVRCEDWDAFKKGQCESEISYMGYPSKPTARGGRYFLRTGGKYPYGLGLNGTKY